MAETKRKLSKSFKQKIIIAVIILLIAGFVIGECVSVLSVRLETQVALATFTIPPRSINEIVTFSAIRTKAAGLAAGLC